MRPADGRVVSNFLVQALLGKPITIYGDGTQTRCFLHVDDAVAAILALANHDGATGQAFNIGNPKPITILGLATRVIDRVGSSSEIRLIPYEEAYEEGFEELGHRTPDIRAVRELVGWTPRRTLDQALDDVIAYQRSELAIGPAGGPNGRPHDRGLIRARGPS
jgi:UDP-glucose 4-epimerase